MDEMGGTWNTRLEMINEPEIVVESPEETWA
jgi:hypothetical protein